MPALPVPGVADPDHEDPLDTRRDDDKDPLDTRRDDDKDPLDTRRDDDKDPLDTRRDDDKDPLDTRRDDDEDADEDALGGDGAGGRMSFLDHLDELRKRLVISVSAIFVGFLIAFAFISLIFDFIMRPLQEILPEGGELVYTEPTEAFFLYIKIAALVGLILAIPVVLMQLWRFVAPGLYGHEKKFAIPFVTLSSLFFVGGCLFSHYLLFPVAWRFLSSFSTDYMTFMPRIQPAFSLYVRLTLACGVVFQMPTVVFFLARVGVVSAGFLLRNTKYAILIIFIVAAVLTPTGDPVTLTMMATPMIVLYALSIGIAWMVAPRRKDDDS